MSHLGDSGSPDQKPESSPSTITIVIVEEGDWTLWEDPVPLCPPVGVEDFRDIVPEKDYLLAAAAERGGRHLLAAAVLSRTAAAMESIIEWWEGLTEAARQEMIAEGKEELLALADEGRRQAAAAALRRRRAQGRARFSGPSRRTAGAVHRDLRWAEERVGLLCLLEGAKSPELAAVITAASQIGWSWAPWLRVEGDDPLFDMGCWVDLSEIDSATDID